jgi:hypothetical protein
VRGAGFDLWLSDAAVVGEYVLLTAADAAKVVERQLERFAQRVAMVAMPPDSEERAQMFLETFDR